jgi:catechol 2,3-dioxygenase-like lactoylglutathione lyase family enzyme
MFLGLRTAIYRAPDIDAARDWYKRILGIEPYFDEPFYVGFNVGGYELGLDPDAAIAQPGAGSVVVYWGVVSAEVAMAMLLEMGATKHSEIRDVGDGIQIASVLDPFGNVLGIIENPHFKLP